MEFKIPRPLSATHEGWAEWHKTARASEPFKYFILETIPDKWWDFQTFFTCPVKDLRYWFRSRFTCRWHVVNTHLEPAYYDSDTRLLHACFALLVDYVELELAHMNGSKRSRAKGLEYLDWEISDTDCQVGGQAQAATIKKELYLWWKDVRPNRPDPDAEYFVLTDRRDAGEEIPDAEMVAVLRNVGTIEKDQYEEDNAQLKKLIDVRYALWT